ncbi:DNA pilot protein [Microviridae sp.]|nr:DNA pilot protein [Microviridae sp.]
MPIGPWLVPAISGVASIASNIFGNSGAKKREQESRDFNLEQWKRQNAYNHPTEQMARLKEAGLNPNMIYGGSPGQATGNAGAVAPGKAPDYRLDNPINALDFEQAKSIRAQTNYTQANEDFLAQRNANQVLKNAILSNDKYISDQGKEAKAEMIKQQLAQMQMKSKVDGLNLMHLSTTQFAKIQNTLLNYRLDGYKEQPAKLMSDLAKNGLTIHDNKIIRMIATASKNPEEMDAFIDNLIKFGGQTLGSGLGAFSGLLKDLFPSSITRILP